MHSNFSSLFCFCNGYEIFPVPLQLRMKSEQLAVKSSRYDSLQRDLAEAEAQVAALCARMQVVYY